MFILKPIKVILTADSVKTLQASCRLCEGLRELCEDMPWHSGLLEQAEYLRDHMEFVEKGMEHKIQELIAELVGNHWQIRIGPDEEAGMYLLRIINPNSKLELVWKAEIGTLPFSMWMITHQLVEQLKGASDASADQES